MTSSGLMGVTAGSSAISTVGQADVGLTYRGYSITDLAAESTFEEVSYLLIYGKLPGQKQLGAYKKKLAGLRSLPDSLKTLLEALPASTHPMDVLRTGTSLLGTLEAEGEVCPHCRAYKLTGELTLEPPIANPRSQLF